MEWSDWQVPLDKVRTPAFPLGADQYDPELLYWETTRRRVSDEGSRRRGRFVVAYRTST